MIEIKLGDGESVVIQDCAGHGSYRGKCPHEGTVFVLLEDDVIGGFYLCGQCDALRKQDIRIFLSEGR